MMLGLEGLKDKKVATSHSETEYVKLADDKNRQYSIKKINRLKFNTLCSCYFSNQSI